VSDQYGVSITPRSAGHRADATVIPAHNPQMRAPNISTTKTTAPKTAETLPLRRRRVAGAPSCRTCRVAGALSFRISWPEAQRRRVETELLASIAKQSPRLIKIGDAGLELDRCEGVPLNTKKQNRTHRRCPARLPARVTRPLIRTNMLPIVLRRIVALPYDRRLQRVCMPPSALG
jgi:hypothetical protein